MEIDTPMQLLAFNAAHDQEKGMATVAAGGPLPLGIFSMDDFMRQHQDAHQAHQAQREAVMAGPATPEAKKTSTAAASPPPPAPVAIGARSSKYTILLHEKYQALGIAQPQFTYQGGSSAGWTSSVSFPGLESIDELQGLSEPRRFNSKQEAKEALSQRAYGVLDALEKQGRVVKTGKARKKSDDDGAQGDQQQQQKPPAENYIGKLLEYQRSMSSPQPTYTDYQSGTRFACLLTLDGHAQPFGSLTTLFGSKKAARHDAARQAIAHFQSLNLWPTDDGDGSSGSGSGSGSGSSGTGGIKKKKKKTKTDGASSLSPATPAATGQATLVSTSTSSAQQVAALATSLGLPTPEWRFTPHPADGTFYSVGCVFRGAGPHEGPLCEVRNIFGKKKAKEECARLTVDYLLALRNKRRAYGARVLEGVVGGDQVLGGAEGRRIEGESDDEAFEDAMEAQVG